MTGKDVLKISGLIISAFCSILIFLTGCTTEVDYDAKKDFAMTDSENTVMTLKIGRRSGDEESDSDIENIVESLHLAFYDLVNGKPSFRMILKAEKQAGNLFRIKCPFSINNRPDFVAGIANQSDDKIIFLSDPLKSISDRLHNTEGLFLMSSPRYFDGDGKDIFYSLLKDENFSVRADSGEPVIINLERLATKVTLKLSSGIDKGLFSISGNNSTQIRLKLNLTRWTITGTDIQSYVFKQLDDFPEKETNIEKGVWNDPSDGRSYWSHSLNWNKTDFPNIGGEGEEKTIEYKRYSEFLSYGFEGIQYFHETTRQESQFTQPNCLPKLVVGGYYTIGNSTEQQTFYLSPGETRELYTESDYWDRIARIQTVIYKETDGKLERLSATELKEILEDSTPTEEEAHRVYSSNFVSPHMKEGAKLVNYCDAVGNAYTEMERGNLNTRLYTGCGVMEKYSEGKCVFTTPVLHFGLQEEHAITGSYGLVRNHYYDFTVTSISGLGHGVSSDDMIVGDFTGDGEENEFTLGISCRILPWHEVNGNIGE